MKNQERIICIKSAPSGRRTRLTRLAKNRAGQSFFRPREIQAFNTQSRQKRFSETKKRNIFHGKAFGYTKIPTRFVLCCPL